MYRELLIFLPKLRDSLSLSHSTTFLHNQRHMNKDYQKEKTAIDESLEDRKSDTGNDIKKDG